MDVLITGADGRCGTTIANHLGDHERYDFAYFDRRDPSGEQPYDWSDTVVGDVADYEAVRNACEGMDAVVHLAGYPHTDGDWSTVLKANVIGTYNVLEAAREAAVDSVVFASTNHVVGKYEEEFAPELYALDHPLVLDHTDPVRPDSYYGASKSFGEDLGRYYVEDFEHPTQFYALRIGSLRVPEYDHPYGDVEAAVEDGDLERGSEAYEEGVRRMKATWLSRRDFAHQIDCCLRDDSVEFGVFSGVSDNRRRWFDLEHARARIGYDPQDDGEEWDAPPERGD